MKSRLYETIYRSEERFHQIAGQINDIFWIAEPGRGGVLYISPAYTVIWNGSPEELSTNPWRILRSIPAEDRPAVAAALRSMDRLPQVIEHRIVRPDGSVR
jgi:PAS domain-containing protein